MQNRVKSHPAAASPSSSGGDGSGFCLSDISQFSSAKPLTSVMNMNRADESGKKNLVLQWNSTLAVEETTEHQAARGPSIPLLSRDGAAKSTRGKRAPKLQP
jgi:cell division inhibitor SulA